ncbi:DegT/DnrJ/EryC1/StrS family aminotransferase [Amycolatopsis sulphurea]|uniref:DegT/DnrJ/EryC1/StrS family aminotransferase n=1 Tax=Amycolatopsis sulphurea TaxID=76022 RepID=UPI000BF6D796|nr:DegT/DnrJ/EryC1/StrS family aminotransferase [Amycolatopsis sulphurea]
MARPENALAEYTGAKYVREAGDGTHAVVLALGDAGVVRTDDREPAETASPLPHHGRFGATGGNFPAISTTTSLPGLNSRMDDLRATVLLTRLEQDIARCAKLAGVPGFRHTWPGTRQRAMRRRVRPPRGVRRRGFESVKGPFTDLHTDFADTLAGVLRGRRRWLGFGARDILRARKPGTHLHRLTVLLVPTVDLVVVR